MFPRTVPSVVASSRHLLSRARPQIPTIVYTNLPSWSPSSIAQPFSNSAKSAFPRKDSQDKDSINTEASEYSKSATDDEGARQGDAAFNPDVTQPQEQKDLAGKNRGVCV